MSNAETLLALLETSKRWPLRDEQPIREQVAVYRAHRESRGEEIRPSWWDSDEPEGRGRRPYIVDPLPSRVSGAFADLIFGSEPTIIAARDADQDELDGIVEGNDLASELQTAEDVCASEGEVWWRILVDRDASPVPILEWHSRLAVCPLLRGRRVLAVAFVSELACDPDKEERYRYVELHADSIVLNLLFRGTKTRLGVSVDLDQREEVADLDERWEHGLPMLAGRIINAKGTSPRVGRSVYHGKLELFQALNETTTVGQENMQLTAKKRAVVPQSYLDRHGRFPAGRDVIVKTATDQGMDEKDGGLSLLEWSFDAEALELYKGGLVDTILTRCRVAPQLLGRHTENAQTGPALKARLLDSILAATGMARPWDDQLPKILSLTAQVSAMPEENGGLGRPWGAPAELPSVDRGSVLPENETEETTRHAMAVGAEIESRETAVRELHPDWDDTQVTAELARIKQDTELPSLDGGEPALNGAFAQTS